MPNVERLIIATSPFQELIMTTRRVYRWEAPMETTKYLVIYITLWYLNLILPGVVSSPLWFQTPSANYGLQLSWMVYIVAERRIHGVTMKDLREDIKHTEDTQRTALSLTEFIEKKGDEHWGNEILQDLGPWLMVQLGDTANLCETLRK